ncbi:MAG: hypothetical protein R6X13_02805 [bacterium]
MSRCASVLLVLLTATIAVGQVDTLWVRHHQYAVSFPNQYMMTTQSAVTDAAGNVHVCAYGQYAAPGMDIIVMKYSSAGELLWSEGLDLGGSDYGYAIALGGDGAVYVTGTAYATLGGSDLVVAKWSAAGGLAWTRRVQGDSVGGYNSGRAIAVSGDEVYVTGSIVNQSTGYDFVVLRLHAVTGVPDWLRTVSRSTVPTTSEAGTDIAVAAGAVFACGQTHTSSTQYDATILRLDATGTIIWQRDYPGSGTASEFLRALDLRGSRVVATGQVSPGVGGTDALTVSYTLDGVLEWAQTFNGPGSGSDYGADVKLDAAGNAVVCGTGSGSGSLDLMTLKYNSTGTRLWARLYDGGAGADAGYSVDVDAAGSVIVGGYYWGGSSRYYLAVVKYSSAGDQGWVYAFQPPGSGGSNAATVVRAYGDDVLVAGYAHWGYPNYTDPVVLRLQEIPDVGVAAVLAPTGTVAPGTIVAPVASVRNFSLRPASGQCRFRIGDGYTVDTSLTLAPGETLAVVFPNWTSGAYGTWAVSCSTMAQFDYDRGNDRAAGLVYVSGPTPDAAVEAIEVPAGNVSYQSTFTPAARWRNRGATAVTCSVYYRIERDGVPVYSQARAFVDLPANGLDTVVRFPTWFAAQIGYYTARCSTALAGDGAPGNDTVSFVFGVVNEAIGQWTQLPDVPWGDAGRAMSKGGSICSDAEKLYVIKGNKTAEAYSYDIAAGTWATLPPVPDGMAGRKVSKGGAVAADGNGRLYVVKGNRTFEFYRYDPALGWTELAEIPPGPRGKAAYGGTGLVHAVINDTGQVYLLKGNGTSEFFRYNTVADSWEPLPDAPLGLSGKSKYKVGSALAAQGDSLIYCLKGYYNEIFRFDPRSSLWLEGQTDVPMFGASGRKKKVKNGGGMVLGGERLTVLKGANTSEFWRLEAADSSWREYPEVPRGMSNRRVKDGGGVAYSGDYYVTKGAKTNELWRFRLVGGGEQIQAGPARLQSGGLAVRVWPNPSWSAPMLWLHAGPAGADARVDVVDATGRVRHSESATCSRDGRLSIASPNLEPGVYFLRVASGGRAGSAKLLVCR